jgi:hypothetical protein
VRWGSARFWNFASRHFEARNPVDICEIGKFYAAGSRIVRRINRPEMSRGIGESTASVANSSFAHLSAVGDWVLTVQGDEI